MLKSMSIVLVLAILLSAIPTPIEAAAPTLEISACQAADGTYTVTIRYYYDGEMYHWYLSLESISESTPTGKSINPQGDTADPLTLVYTGWPAGTEVMAQLFPLPITSGSPVYSESTTLGPGYPSCGGSPSPGSPSSRHAKPLFNMWLMTGGGKYCILVSNDPPSVWSQRALCFPGQDWEAEEMLCHAPLYDNDFWECDRYGKARLHIDDLMKYYERHKLPWEKHQEAAPTPEPN